MCACVCDAGCLQAARATAWPPPWRSAVPPTTAARPATCPAPATPPEAPLIGDRSPCPSSKRDPAKPVIPLRPAVLTAEASGSAHRGGGANRPLCPSAPFTRFVGSRHSPMPAERREVMADSGSGGKSTPGWSRMDEGGGPERGSTGEPHSLLSYLQREV